MIEGYRDSVNGSWRFQFHYSSQVNQQPKIIEHNPQTNQKTSKHWCQQIKTKAPQHPKEYLPTSQHYLAIFYHQIICCKKKLTLLQAINYGLLLNMTRSHRKNNYKVSPRVINYCQRSHWTTEKAFSCKCCWKYHTCSKQVRGRKKLGTLAAIWPNWKNILWPYR